MSQWFDRWFGGASAAADKTLALQRDLQALRLELAERDKTLANLRAELERQRAAEQTRSDLATRTKLERLLSDAAAPVAQLLAQADLLEARGKPVHAQDVLAVAKRLVRALEDHGLTLEGQVGAPVAFDPNQHEPLSATAALAPGQTVVIRLVGIACHGKLLRRAGVEPATK